MYVPKDNVGVMCFYVHYFDLDLFAPDFFGWLIFIFLFIRCLKTYLKVIRYYLFVRYLSACFIVIALCLFTEIIGKGVGTESGYSITLNMHQPSGRRW